jgi:hypothetical protein
MGSFLRSVLEALAMAASIAHTALRESALAEVEPRAYRTWAGGPSDLTVYVRPGHDDADLDLGERAA